MEITLTVNGHPHRLAVGVRTTLLDVLRERLGLTGAKKGCDQGQCGARTLPLEALHRLPEDPRVVRAFAAGRIINPRLAHSQLMGGMIWGISSALHEATEIDRRAARYTNDNIAEYLIPVSADVGEVDIIIVPEADARVNPVGMTGLGEIGVVGMNAAIANAVHHATGHRVRSLPIRIDDLIRQ